MHKFGKNGAKNGGNNDTLFSNDDFMSNQENETFCGSKSLSKKFSDVVQKVYYKGAISFRENIDPKILVNNLKSEIEMTEQQLIMYKEIEQRLMDLVHQIYQKLENHISISDPEMKNINKCLR